MATAPTAEYHSRDFDWEELRDEVENDPSLLYHLTPSAPSLPPCNADAWRSFHRRHSSGKFFKVFLSKISVFSLFIRKISLFHELIYRLRVVCDLVWELFVLLIYLRKEGICWRSFRSWEVVMVLLKFWRWDVGMGALFFPSYGI